MQTNFLLEIGKILVLIGGGILFLGVIFLFLSKFNFLGKLPGDIIIKRDGFIFYFPLTTCLLLSLFLSFLFFLFKFLMKK